jgi:hypothetical protein
MGLRHPKASDCVADACLDRIHDASVPRSRSAVEPLATLCSRGYPFRPC